MQYATLGGDSSFKKAKERNLSARTTVIMGASSVPDSLSRRFSDTLSVIQYRVD